MQATIASQFAPVAARANATSSRAQRVPGICRIRAAAPATRVAAPVAGASSLAIGSTFAADRALNVAVARQVTLKPQPARGKEARWDDSVPDVVDDDDDALIAGLQGDEDLC